MLVKDEGLNNCTSWIFELSTILEQCSPLSSASQPRQGRSWDQTIHNLILFRCWQRWDRGPWWWPSSPLGETPQLQPHSLGTYPWVICFLQTSSSDTSTSALLCVPPHNWECTDDTKLPMSVMNQNWVCGSMCRTKPKTNKKKLLGKKVAPLCTYQENILTDMSSRNAFTSAFNPQTLDPPSFKLSPPVRKLDLPMGK